MEENLEQPIQKSLSPQKKFTLRSPKLIILLSLIILLCVVVLAALFYFGKAQKITTVNQEENLVISIKPTSKTGEIAYRKGNSVLDTGDIWISNANGTEKKQLTKSKNIHGVEGWSPDNNYILASTSDQSKPFVIVNATTGAVLDLALPNKIDYLKSLSWINSREFSFITDNKLFKSDLDGKVSLVSVLPTILNTYNITPNSNLDFIAYDTNVVADYPREVKVYTYNLLTKQTYQLTQYDKNHPYLLEGWYKNMVLYDNGIDYWLSTPDGKTKTQISLEGWKILSINFSSNKELYVSAENNDAKVTPRRMVFLYQYPNTFKKLYSPVNLPKGNLSRDGRFLINDGISVVDLESGATLKLCESSCYYPAWQN